MDSETSIPARTPPPRHEFDEETYLQLYPDIARGIAAGAIESGWAHFVQHGCREGRQWARKPDPLQGVARDIAPDDEMFTGDVVHYFDVGASALQVIESALGTARRPKSSILRILDLPCGHGRVMRFLRKTFPEAQLTACDLNRGGVEYCAKAFGAEPVFSSEAIAAIPLTAGFDLIWCGSLLTHLPAAKCEEFVRFFSGLLGLHGILVFTMHGRHYARELSAGKNPHGFAHTELPELLRSYREQGFGYVDYTARSAYGFSLAHPSFVMNRLVEISGCRLVGYHETGWDKRQDVISLQKH